MANIKYTSIIRLNTVSMAGIHIYNVFTNRYNSFINRIILKIRKILSNLKN